MMLLHQQSLCGWQCTAAAAARNQPLPAATAAPGVDAAFALHNTALLPPAGMP